MRGSVSHGRAPRDHQEVESCSGVIGAAGGTTPTRGGSNDGTGACATLMNETPEPQTLGLIGIGLIRLGLICGGRKQNADCPVALAHQLINAVRSSLVGAR